MRPADSPRNDQKLANRTKTYGPPRLQAILRSGLVRLRQRIRSQTIGPGQDGDSRVPLLINFTASKHTGTRFPGRRSMVRPSRFHHQQTSLAFAFRKRSAYSASKRYRAGIEVSLRRNTGQSKRASLLAKATTATFLGTRGVSARSHATPGPWRKQCAAASQNYVRNFRALGQKCSSGNILGGLGLGLLPRGGTPSVALRHYPHPRRVARGRHLPCETLAHTSNPMRSRR
jgi:hypothetical protein